MNTIYYTTYPWEFTNIFLAATKNGLCRISFSRNFSEEEFVASLEKKYGRKVTADKIPFNSLLEKLENYFNGLLVEFDEKLDLLEGPDFQKKVWQKVSEIKYGHLKTYKQIAIELGNPKSVRAVGTANGANPIPLIIPCHRVVQTSGGLGGYSAGLDVKDALLRLEGAVF